MLFSRFIVCLEFLAAGLVRNRHHMPDQKHRRILGGGDAHVIIPPHCHAIVVKALPLERLSDEIPAAVYIEGLLHFRNRGSAADIEPERLRRRRFHIPYKHPLLSLFGLPQQLVGHCLAVPQHTRVRRRRKEIDAGKQLPEISGLYSRTRNRLPGCRSRQNGGLFGNLLHAFGCLHNNQVIARNGRRKCRNPVCHGLPFLRGTAEQQHRRTHQGLHQLPPQPCTESDGLLLRRPRLLT